MSWYWWVLLMALLGVSLRITITWPRQHSTPYRGPLLGDKDGRVDQAPIMRAGSIISCPNDHWLYRLTRDIEAGKGQPMRSTDVEGIEDTMPLPKAGEPARLDCSYCGEPWRRLLPGGRAQVHFITGWWPKLETKGK